MRKMASIKNKLTVSFVSLSLMSLILLGTIVYNKVYNTTQKDYIHSIEKQITQVDNSFNNYIVGFEENLNMFSKGILNLENQLTSYIDKGYGTDYMSPRSPADEELESSLYKNFENFSETHDGIESVFISSESNGGYMQYPSVPREKGYDPRTRSWYSEGKNSKDKVSFTDVYKTSSGDMVISTITSIKDGNSNFKGVIGF
ncbi:hypothetical protein [Clostridium simiarum]|uniref:PDC sensor domain-containing protein n=1 Tax=Clostridium simiarum TaxID=2841506 RepID=UPI001FEA59CE|nr:hypothetical protein [Clostridium simiarum]